MTKWSAVCWLALGVAEAARVPSDKVQVIEDATERGRAERASEKAGARESSFHVRLKTALCLLLPDSEYAKEALRAKEASRERSRTPQRKN